MKTREKQKYSMWQNTAYMLRCSWKSYRSVPAMCAAIASVTAAETVVQLLIAPAVLGKVETGAPLRALITTIAVFCAALFLLSGGRAYLNENALYARIGVRIFLVSSFDDKLARTSYPNLLDTEFIRAEEKAFHICGDNSQATEHIWTTWTQILTNGIGFCVYLALLSNLNLWLAAVMASVTAVGYLVNSRINEWDYRHRQEEAACQKELSYVRRTATDRHYAKDIRIFGLKGWLDDVWNAAMRSYEAFLMKRERVYIWTNLMDLLLAFLRNGIAYVYLLQLVLAQGMSASQFLLYFGAATGFTQWVSGILDQFQVLHRESNDISAFREFLEWREPFLFEEGKPLAMQKDARYEIRFEKVSFRYPAAKKDTITDLDLTIRAGEKLAVVGLNGAGKTTLVKLACGFLDPTRGRVLLNGADVRQYNRRDYYALFSAVFQDFSVLESSVAENVAQRVDGIEEDRVWACLDQAGLTQKVKSMPLGLQTKLGREVYEDGVELSGGQMQRLMLARALYKDAPILVLDEPTAALDPLAEHDIYMKYQAMTGGRTAVFISHRFASTRFCDRIILLADDRIAEEGTHEALLKRGGVYAKLFETQSQYYEEGGAHNGE